MRGTFFIATGHRDPEESATNGMDASHRGGDPGFVAVEDPHTLSIPDYAGNNHYNTLGNLLLDPRAGLLFLDFEGGHTLQLTGRVELLWQPDAATLARFPGARRLLRFHLDEAVELESALPIRFGPAGQGLRSLRVVGKRRETAEVTSFELEARDAGELPGFAAGQHLPIRVSIDGTSVERTYSLSGAPFGAAGGPVRYRISVKREALGAVSRFLHDELAVGDIIGARAPAGEFVLDESGPRPVMLVSAGVGITPLLSMAHAWPKAAATGRCGSCTGHGMERTTRSARRCAGSPHDIPPCGLYFVYSRKSPGDPCHTTGRVDAALLERLLPGLEADFYLCGPAGFMADVQQGLERRGVAERRIHTESFGPAAS